jgi:hypothetical protein
MARSHLATAARVILYINGQPYAQATSFRWDSATPARALYGLDCGEPYELAHTVTKITGQIGLLRVVGDGGLEGAGVVQHFADVPKGRYFTLALIDRVTDTQLFRADRCKATSQSWNVPSKGRIEGTLTFEALDWSNEALPASQH